MKKLLYRLMGEVSYIDEFKWPMDPLPWYNSMDINSLYPDTIRNLIPPTQDSPTFSYIEKQLNG